MGAIEALAVNDGGFAVPVEECPFGVGLPREEVSAVLDDRRIDPGVVQIPFNVLVLRIGGRLVMVDSGCGVHNGAAGGRLLQHLETAGIKASDISVVILTHAHGDHIGVLLASDFKTTVFPNAELFVNRVEYDFWTSDQLDLSRMAAPESMRAGMAKGARTALLALASRWQKVAPGDRILDGLELIPAYGHTPGHMAVLVSSGKNQLLHMVDAAHHHAVSLRRPDWMLAFDADPEMASRSRRMLFDRADADRLRVFGAHMPFPSLGAIRKANDGYDYLMEPWSIA